MMTRAEIEQVFSLAFAAAKASAYVQQWQKEFPELWSDEQLARNVPLRVEFEQVYVFGTVAEAISWAGGFGGDAGKGRNKRGWGSIVRVDPVGSRRPSRCEARNLYSQRIIPIPSAFRSAATDQADDA